GGKISNIDGLIRANGTANLFFINPNGIIFGQNARLNIGGSFLGSTANSIVFNDEFNFSAINPKVTPLLTVNVPIGLQFGDGIGEIRAVGTGNGFTTKNPLATPIERNINNTSGLQVKAGNTLALIGSNVNLEGSTLTAEGGRIELGGVEKGLVSLNFTTSGFTVNYEQVRSFRDINLSQQAAVDASGQGSGSIQIVGRQVSLTNGSMALIQNQGAQPSGEIRVNAFESLKLIGTSLDGTVRSGLLTETLASGNGGNIIVSTNLLSVIDGAQIFAKSISSGTGGNVNVNAAQTTEVRGFSIVNPGAFSWVGTIAISSGNAGNVTTSTGKLIITDGATVSAPTVGSGNGGNVTLNVSELVEVIGSIPNISQPSSVGSATSNTGDVGDVTVNTSRVVLRDGGIITTSTLAQGSAGNLTVNATDSIEVTGRAVGGGLPSRIESSAPIEAEEFRRRFGLPDAPSGNSGSVTINTPRLTIADGARVSVANEGTGIAGNLNINANSIVLLDSKGGITAATASGEGGNINLSTNFLQLRNASQISTQAGGTGNGGNITINTNNIALLENSQINANAFEGAGGNIRINTQGLFNSA
ncbi:filamentous hemagglutinin N-terminal domain-containing protein, partial [Floridanema evergladense]